MLSIVGSTTNYVNSVPFPQDGVDPETAASLQPAIQQVADNVATERADRVAAVAAAAATAAAATAAVAATEAARKTILDVEQTVLATTFIVTSNVFVDVTGLSVALVCAVGDVLLIDASLLLVALDYVSAKIMIDDGGAVDPGQVVRVPLTEYSSGNVIGATHVARSFKYVVVNAGTVTIKAQAKSVSLALDVLGTASTDGAGSSIRVVRIGT